METEEFLVDSENNSNTFENPIYIQQEPFYRVLSGLEIADSLFKELEKKGKCIFQNLFLKTSIYKL